MFSKLGRFEIKDVLGRGAMGEVYLGVDPVLGREVAIKTIISSALPEDQARQRFDREAKAAAVLNSPNIVTIHELGEDQGVLFIAMERLKGQDLEQLLMQRSLTLVESLEVLAQVCDGLDSAHRHHIIHRDIKPSNIMVMREGRKLLVKLMDFGVARLKDSAMTMKGTVVGTVNYIAPEYIRSGEPDARSDLFAVGVMLYECIAGRKPFEGGSASTVLFKIVNDPPDPLDLPMLQGLSPALRNMTERSLAKDPADRFQSAEEFALALRAAKDPAWKGKVEETTVRMKIQPMEPLPVPAGQTVILAVPPMPGTDPMISTAPKAITQEVAVPPVPALAAKTEVLTQFDLLSTKLATQEGLVIPGPAGATPADRTEAIALPEALEPVRPTAGSPEPKLPAPSEPDRQPLGLPTVILAVSPMPGTDPMISTALPEAKAIAQEVVVPPVPALAAKTEVLTQLDLLSTKLATPSEPDRQPLGLPTVILAVSPMPGTDPMISTAPKAITQEVVVPPVPALAAKTEVLTQLDLLSTKLVTQEGLIIPGPAGATPADRTEAIALPEALEPVRAAAVSPASKLPMPAEPVRQPHGLPTVILKLPQPLLPPKPPIPIAPSPELVASQAGTQEVSAKLESLQPPEPAPPVAPLAAKTEVVDLSEGVVAPPVVPLVPELITPKASALQAAMQPPPIPVPPVEPKTEAFTLPQVPVPPVAVLPATTPQIDARPPKEPPVIPSRTEPVVPEFALDIPVALAPAPEASIAAGAIPTSPDIPPRSNKGLSAMALGLIALVLLGGLGYFLFKARSSTPAASVLPTPPVPPAVIPAPVVQPPPPPEVAEPVPPVNPSKVPAKPKSKAPAKAAPPVVKAPEPAPEVVAPPPPPVVTAAPPPPVPDAKTLKRLAAEEAARKRAAAEEQRSGKK